MATVSLNRVDLFPAGTTVKAFAIPSPAPARMESLTGSPATWRYAMGSGFVETANGVVAADGALEINGLLAEQEYVLYASVAGADRYLRMTPSTFVAKPTLQERVRAKREAVGAV